MFDSNTMNEVDTLEYFNSNGDVVEGKVCVDFNKLVVHNTSDPTKPATSHYIYDKTIGKWREPITLYELLTEFK